MKLLAITPGHQVTMARIAREVGLSRQAIYLHFSSRSQLLDASFEHLDETLKLNSRMKGFRKAKHARQRLSRFITFWGHYVPQIYGVSKALMVAQANDPAAAKAWAVRLSALRDGCSSVIDGLHAEGLLAKGWSRTTGTDALCAMLSITSWEMVCRQCGWSEEDYIKRLKKMAKSTFVRS